MKQTIEENARSILAEVKALQDKAPNVNLACPRCGKYVAETERNNILSSQENVHICSECYKDEIKRDYARIAHLPLKCWALTSFMWPKNKEEHYE